MLPDKFRTYFEQQAEAALTDRGGELTAATRQLREDSIRAGGFGGTRYLAGLQDLYSREVEERGRAIVRALRTATAAFADDLTEAHDPEFLQLAESLLDAQIEALRDAYRRGGERAAGLQQLQQLESLNDLRVAAASAMLSNMVRRALWELHNLPKAPSMTNHNTVNVSGNVYGAAQAGTGATASVQQTISNGTDVEALIVALEQFRKTIESANVEPDARALVLAQAESAEQELRAAAPNRTRLLGYLGGIGAIVQTLGSSREAWDAVKHFAQACGIPLP